MTWLCQVAFRILGNVSNVFLLYVLECPTFRISQRVDMGIKLNISVPTVQSSVWKLSDCLALCLDRNCTMFSHYHSECWLYTKTFDETMTESQRGTYLYIRECISTGTYWFLLYICRQCVSYSFRRHIHYMRNMIHTD